MSLLLDQAVDIARDENKYGMNPNAGSNLRKNIKNNDIDDSSVSTLENKKSNIDFYLKSKELNSNPEVPMPILIFVLFIFSLVVLAFLYFSQ